MNNLRIGVPSKGRLADLAGELLKEAGLSFRRQERSLFARCREMPIDITFLRTDDIPVLCAEGAIDLGITGSDLVAESGVELATRLALGMGHCRLAICVPEDREISDPNQLDGLRIATSFPHLTESFLRHAGATAHVVTLSGSVEIMVALGVADAVVDLIETGSTLAANRLRVLAEIGRYETVLVQNRELRQSELSDRIVRRLEGVVIARSYCCWSTTSLAASWPKPKRSPPASTLPRSARWKMPIGAPFGSWFAAAKSFRSWSNSKRSAPRPFWKCKSKTAVSEAGDN